MSDIIITRLYEKQLSRIVTLSLDTKLQDLINNTLDLNTKYFIEVNYEDEVITVSLSELFLETTLNTCNTIQELQDNLNPLLVKSYESDFAALTDSNKSLIATQILSDPDYTIGYVDRLVPLDRNHPSFIYRLKDIVISKTSSKNPVDFTKCICSINGLVGLPSVYEDELFIADGTTFMMNTIETILPDIVMLDFTELGNIEVVKFNECELEGKNINKKLQANSNIGLVLPDHISLIDKSVLVVIGNTLFFEYAPQITGTRTLVISPQILPLQQALLKKANYQMEFIGDTNLVTTVDMNEYLESTRSPNDTSAFLIIVDAKRLTTISTPMHQYAEDVNENINYRTLAYDFTNTSIRSYTYLDWDSKDDIFLEEFTPCVNLIDNCFGKPLSITKHKHYSKKYDFMNLDEPKYKFLRLISV